MECPNDNPRLLVTNIFIIHLLLFRCLQVLLTIGFTLRYQEVSSFVTSSHKKIFKDIHRCVLSSLESLVDLNVGYRPRPPPQILVRTTVRGRRTGNLSRSPLKRGVDLFVFQFLWHTFTCVPSKPLRGKKETRFPLNLRFLFSSQSFNE